VEQPVLLLGVGNILLQDEGLGVRAVQHLTARYDLPPQVQALDGGVKGLDLLPYLQGKAAVLVLDAVQSDAAPGTLVRLEGDAIRTALSLKMSMHQIGIQELLAVAQFQGTLPPRVVVWGMEPAALQPGLSLSSAVAAKLDALVEAAVGELREWGLTVVDQAQSDPDTGDGSSTTDHGAARRGES
jgi:hydrogenase maturation protease